MGPAPARMVERIKQELVLRKKGTLEVEGSQ